MSHTNRYNTRELGEQFRSGAEKGWISTKNLRIEAVAEGVTVLMSYGAVIAKRDANAREIVVYDGWRGFSQTTATHMGKALSRRHDDDHNPVRDYCERNGFEYRESRESPRLSDLETGVEA